MAPSLYSAFRDHMHAMIPPYDKFLHKLIGHVATIVDHAIMKNLGVAASKASSSTYG
jgi:hypothetical protein